MATPYQVMAEQEASQVRAEQEASQVMAEQEAPQIVVDDKDENDSTLAFWLSSAGLGIGFVGVLIVAGIIAWITVSELVHSGCIKLKNRQTTQF